MTFNQHGKLSNDRVKYNSKIDLELTSVPKPTKPNVV